MSKNQKLSIQQIKFLRGIAHGLNPVVTIGINGVTDSLMEEVESSLAHHELLKIKLAAAERDDRKAIIDHVVQQTGSQLVQSIGKVFVIFRPKEKSEIVLPK
ncbi:ribosome assembly RNA-binding protein YhbY [Hydrogenovibrio marinus]|jgi:RNA-binding protein|uniref:RNA-binding protein YhbY n=1 Tax=Hydrogenovibrio marinus TaxID=28885 RepID=A0A066ZYR1_HYDMR|nr:ribosome assembly RNA-binding protein YhbY [Hydrogenovibrio marinus]KDN95496.1 RNA-binding protein YhbY [Hydrogenovibrio marinus]BBN59988.1 RNA-binding protein [Hydrogenovibrio marinus]